MDWIGLDWIGLDWIGSENLSMRKGRERLVYMNYSVQQSFEREKGTQRVGKAKQKQNEALSALAQQKRTMDMEREERQNRNREQYKKEALSLANQRQREVNTYLHTVEKEKLTKEPPKQSVLLLTKQDTYTWIQTLGVCTSVKSKDIEAYTYFKQLFATKYVPDSEEHPNKLVGVVDFTIRRQPLAQALFARNEISEDQVKLEMGIVKEDGTEDSISWLSCFDGQTTGREKFISACILSVHNHPKELEKGKTHFRFVDTFLNEKKDVIGLVPSRFAKNEFHQHVFREEDAAFRKAWVDYYNAHTKTPCRTCTPVVADEEGWTTV